MANAGDRLEQLIREVCDRSSVISFAGGFPATETIPQEALSQAALSAVRTLPRVEASLQYCWPEGKPALRKWVAARLAQRGVRVEPDEVIITAGAQQALSLSYRALGEPGTRVLVDPISYPGALDVMRSAGAQFTEDPARAQVAYLMAGVANPVGHDSLPVHWRVLRERDCPLIVDEAYAELRFDGALPPALLGEARERVFHVGTVSKSICPGLRIGWLVPPPSRLRGFLDDKTHDDLQAGTFAQTLLSGLLCRIDYDAHLRGVRALYRERAACLARALQRSLPQLAFRAPEGGFSLYADTGCRMEEVAFFEACVAEEVIYDPGSRFVAEPRDTDTLKLRLCFSSLSPERIERGVERLARAWARVS
ncbi:MAG: PLP-dependent aminotransferase family protein [Myxococcales bacterium]